jgi:methionyl-tRNA formyltransferase
MSKPTLVILATDGQSTNMLYHALKDNYDVKVVLEERISRVELVKKRLKKFSVPMVMGQLLFQIGYLPWLRRKSGQRLAEIEEQNNLINLAIPQNVTTWVNSANSEQCRLLLQSINPAVVVLCGTRILNAATLNCLRVPFVNIHAGITPLYRGVHGGYWALANNDPENCGVTVHFVDSGIDTGNILAQGVIKPTSQDNFTTYPILQLAKGITLICECLPSVINGTAVATKPQGKGKLWYHPTLAQYLRIKREKGVG